MGTRSITHIHEMQSLDESEHVVCSFYRPWDGYPSGHGEDLARWLENKRLVNGISSNENGEENVNFFNRAGTMAVFLMSHIMEQSGCEVISTGNSDMWEEYTYHVYFHDNDFYIQVDDTFPLKCSDFNGKQFEDMQE